VGIDIDVAEILLADRLREKGTHVDFILSHHPSGRALARLHDVMWVQTDMLQELGVSISAAEDLMAARTKEIKARVASGNHARTEDAARLLGIPLACIHTPAANWVSSYLKRLFDEHRPQRLKDLVDILMTIPEYQEASRNSVGPSILVGNGERRTGRIALEMTGGTSGSTEIFANLEHAGVNTIVGMHMTEQHQKEAVKHHINVVIAGHISSDTIGMNLLLDAIFRKAGENLQVIPCSGFRRNSR